MMSPSGPGQPGYISPVFKLGRPAPVMTTICTQTICPNGLTGPQGPSGIQGPFGSDYSIHLLSLIMSLHKKIPDHTLFANENDELMILSPPNITKLLYKGPIEDCDITIDNQRIKITAEQEEQLIIWRVILL